MNIIRYGILGIQRAGLRRFAGIIAAKSFRRLIEHRRDRIIDRGRAHRDEPFVFIPLLPDNAASRFKKKFPGSLKSLIAQAQAIRARRFEFLGQKFAFKGKINWHQDPATKQDWEKKVYQETSIYSAGSPRDVKPLWELNRHQFFVTLGQAFAVTGDRVYLDELLSQWSDWIEENPYRHGINWASPLEVAVRLISWTLAFQFVESHISRETRSTITRSVWQQASFLSTHLSTDKIVRTNHLIGEAAGLYIVATSFSFRESDRWRKKGQELLEEEAQNQLFGDSVSREQSSSYHRFDVDFLLLSFLAGRSSTTPFSPSYAMRLKSMLKYLDAVRTPDSYLPCYGDSDNGRGFILAPTVDFWDARGLVAAGGCLCKDDELFKKDLLNEESFWLLNEREWNSAPAKKAVRLSEQPMKLFGESGHIVIRNEKRGDYCFFRAGEFGLGGSGFSSHSHNDLFSPILYIGGVLIFTDTGTSLYTGNDEERDYLRSAKAHNTTTSPSWEYFEPLRWFGWRKCMDGKIFHNASPANEVNIECGYEISALNAYSRTMKYRPKEGRFIIEDRVGDRSVSLHTYFHLDNGLTVQTQADSIVIRKGRKKVARCDFSDNLSLQVDESWISKSYGKKEPSLVLHFRWSSETDRPALFSIRRA